LNTSQFAHLGTRLELAMSTRGASLWVRNTPTGLPTGRAGSGPPRAARASRRSCRSMPSCARRDRSRRRQRGSGGPPRPRRRGCSSSIRTAASVVQLLARMSLPRRRGCGGYYRALFSDLGQSRLLLQPLESPDPGAASWQFMPERASIRSGAEARANGDDCDTRR
jgi:hypothetical protein